MRMPAKNGSEESSPSFILQWIADMEQRLSRRNVTTLNDKLRSSSFCFEIPPAACSFVEPVVSNDSLELVAGSPNNTLALSHEDWLHSCTNLANRYTVQYANDNGIAPLLDRLLSSLQADSARLRDIKHQEWERQRIVSQEVNSVDPGVYMTFLFLNMESWAAVAYVAILCLYLATGVSQAQCSFYCYNFTNL
ncbi:hypothetical protein AGABI2DRAFT_115377 [Agaricus bisporus var. bisporus H97]|uniref:hypothetical protein n=1 Tax=Agaricus bisporus var. bisporus (strain H97 / ATCC MYA-4626 / FGSC 10389) TaxID=936046 RepID=UPI00029F61F1|nr:hypothetical protein AGABI2DRAFT_115377 [Agaricus bisporus var. bisporus H97]EKV50314.1 hypothetical protein AGABI2DRAFT_115377 [Agaricus bisporus var. bisporus H97]